LDAYLAAYASEDPRSTVALADQFASKYPRSEFLGLAYQCQMSAYQRLNDYEGVLRAGERALALVPGNLNTLLTLAAVIPNGVTGRADASRRLAQAETYAQQALSQLGELKIPREIALEKWETMKAGMESEGHEALGHVRLKQGDVAGAVQEFRAAALGNPAPNGRQFLRLSSAYLLAGQSEASERAAERAAQLSEGDLHRLALKQLRTLREAKKK
jgi:tetratricopeptide (TPR) repeat protein